MNIFAFHKMNEVKGRISFYKPEFEGVILLDKFEKEITKTKKLSSQLKTVFANMELVANLNKLPNNKYHPIDIGNENTGVFEFKTKDLRNAVKRR